MRAPAHTHTHTLMCFTHSIDPVFRTSDNMMWNKSYKYKKKKERQREREKICNTLLEICTQYQNFI